MVIEVGRSGVLLAVLTVINKKEKLIKNELQIQQIIDQADLHDQGHRVNRYATALEEIFARVDRQHLRNVTKITVIYDAPWGGSFWKDVVESSHRPIKYTKGQQEKMTKRALSEYHSTTHHDKDHEQVLLGLTPIHEKLNGYHFLEPFGKRAEEISLTLQYDLVAQVMQKAVEGTIKKVLPHHRVEHTTHDALLYSAIEKFTGHDQLSTLFVFVDEGRTTVVLHTKKGAIEKRDVQIGIETIIEQVQSVAGKDHHRATHLLQLFFQNRLEASLQQQITEQCGVVAGIWQRQLQEVLMQITQATMFPDKAIYSISDSFERIIERRMVEKIVKSAIPAESTVTFFDFRDNALVIDGAGVVSKHVVYFYVASLL